ncbi:MAG: hypothetical protein KDK36_18140, partial [Leptospiraceae bacterium]|nr:hypothetical protein [Leptospiraceae bacterium]
MKNLAKLFLNISFILIVFFPENIFSIPTIKIQNNSDTNILQNIEFSLRYQNENDINEILKSTDNDWKKFNRKEIFFYDTPQKNLWIRFELENEF